MKGDDFVDLSNIVKWRSKFIVSKGIVIRSVKRQILIVRFFEGTRKRKNKL